jgi:hypothetical protein
MPEVMAKHFKAQAARAQALHARTRSIPESIEPHPDLLTEPDPVELVYNIRTGKFRTSYRSNLVPEDLTTAFLVEIPANIPPLLVDGRMQIVEIPKWKFKVDFLWRSSDGRWTRIHERVVKLPRWVWIGRNFKGKWTELWIERC